MRILVPFFLLFVSGIMAQDKPFIRLVDGPREFSRVRNPTQYLSGSTCKKCLLSINGQKVNVYPTGAFAHELKLEPGINVFNIVATAAPDKVNKKITYNYILPSRDSVKEFGIDSIETFPRGNLVLQAGEKIRFRVKAWPGSRVVVNGNTPLYEMPVSTAGIGGIYQGEYVIKESDNFMNFLIPVTITDETGKTMTRTTENRVSVFPKTGPDMLITRGRLAHLLFGLGEDRLGGAKIGYIDSLIPLKMIGKVDSNYQVRLSKYRTAYIPSDVISFLPRGTFTPASLTGSWRVWGDSFCVNEMISSTNASTLSGS